MIERPAGSSPAADEEDRSALHIDLPRDVLYWPAGHTGWTDEGVTFIEFSPTAEILPILDHLARQLGSG